ncbi:hypothetical protein AIIKEEIJ_05320 [Rhodococcus sp. YH1]|nr:hypothetical protein [Rhodococcus sp. YH1]
MGEGRGRGDREAGDDREDRGERDGGDDAEEDGAAEFEGEQRRGRVLLAGGAEDDVRSDHLGGTVAEHQCEQVEPADQGDGPGHRAPGLLGGGHGVEAHQHVRQAGGAEHQGDAERDEVEPGHVADAVLGAGGEHVAAGDGLVGGAVHHGLRVGQQLREVAADREQHEHEHDAGTGDEQHGLDHLHVGGALHAADEHVHDHQDADHGDDDALAELAVDVEQQRDEATRTGHLGEQVEQRHREGGQRGGHTHRTLLEPEAQDIGHGEPAGVAQQFGDEQQGDEPGDEEADGVQESVVAVDGDGAGDAEERRGRQVVAGDREAVLRAGELPAAGVEVRGLLGGAAGPDDQAHRHDDECDENRDVEQGVADVGGTLGQNCHWAGPSSSSRIAADRGSRSRLANRT